MDGPWSRGNGARSGYDVRTRRLRGGPEGRDGVNRDVHTMKIEIEHEGSWRSRARRQGDARACKLRAVIAGGCNRAEPCGEAGRAARTDGKLRGPNGKGQIKRALIVACRSRSQLDQLRNTVLQGWASLQSGPIERPVHFPKVEYRTIAPYAMKRSIGFVSIEHWFSLIDPILSRPGRPPLEIGSRCREQSLGATP